MYFIKQLVNDRLRLSVFCRFRRHFMDKLNPIQTIPIFKINLQANEIVKFDITLNVKL